MRHAFVSVVGVLYSNRNLHDLSGWLEVAYAQLEGQFTDFEIVVVNNCLDGAAIDAVIQPLPEAIRKHVFMLNLSTSVSRDNAWLAGLDRANGDYTILLEFDFMEKKDAISLLWNQSQTTGQDIVYFKAHERKLPFHQRLMYRIFYGIMQKYSGLTLDPWAHHTRIISRRALNSLLRLRENSRYLKANFALVGFKNGAISVDEPLPNDPDTSFGDQFRTALVAVTSFTTFLRSMMLWIFIFSVIVALLSIINAVKVKLTNVDIFGDQVESLSGWAFLVVMISVFFAIVFLNLYIISIYLSNIYNEIKNRPLYIIESVKRY